MITKNLLHLSQGSVLGIQVIGEMASPRNPDAAYRCWDCKEAVPPKPKIIPATTEWPEVATTNFARLAGLRVPPLKALKLSTKTAYPCIDTAT